MISFIVAASGFTIIGGSLSRRKQPGAKSPSNLILPVCRSI